ncbi:MAG: hypothetical protein KDD51_05400 [Bdellovibrionales bacterium]|nr:hypothetical protein [Bdellovibrionales bacterium]
MHRLLSCLLLTSFLVSAPLYADYAWIPNYQTLFLRFGGEFFTTSENFGADGLRTDILYQRGAFANLPLRLNEFRFYVEPEYGFAKNLSLLLKGEFTVARIGPVSASEPSFGSSNVGNVKGALKWRIHPKEPILTLEIGFGLPTASNDQSSLQVDDLLLNDGTFDLGLILHTGYRFDDFFVAFSPGLLLRSGGFPSALTVQAAAGGRFDSLYGFLFLNSIFSIQTGPLLDSSLSNHDALGGGGSYAKLSGGARGIDGGIKVGVNIEKKYAIELGVTQAFWGSQYPNFTKIGLNFLFVNSFFKEDKKIRVRGVPFDQEHSRPKKDGDESGAVKKEAIQPEP